ncbi:conserved hypothetical protein [Rippkaea orientalis PCC 8801]|uniref:Septum formation initiator n=1 Tax=Rippkaea orientalis (strain PCC 8801 / RF-1) TaxID=41431 RepID=B7JYR0_RIPO1|nr:hypothetical protein [Rippkaea orientalis]ACK64930.1 conserved hypothetical protein [Rippkaea orientalis PCC 8801]
MAALQSLEVPVTRKSRPSRQRRQRPSSQPRHHDHQWVAAEISVKLVVNGTLSIIAVLTLLKLLPYQMSQQEKLQEIRTQVQETEERVSRFRADFSQSFDPHQVKKVMQENSPLIEPNKRRIFWQ